MVFWKPILCRFALRAQKEVDFHIHALAKGCKIIICVWCLSCV